MDRAKAKKGFLDGGLWELDPAAIGGLKGKGVAFMQFVAFVGANFYNNDAFLRASALSFTTLLSFVPLFALAFSVLKGLGAQNKVAPWILNQVAAGSEVVVNRVITYIGNTNMGSVGAIGLAALLYTAISMLGSIESAFNAVWGVSKTRSYYRMFTDYLSVLVSAPLLLLAATSITTTLQSKWFVTWVMERTYLGDIFLFSLSLIPYVTVWAAIFLLYIFMPNTRVRYSSAIIGAVLAGTLWEGAQWAYINFQVGASKYNAIYGTLAALPILMVWIYTSWVIVLFGMEVVAAHQNRATFRRDLRGGPVSQELRELVALALLRHVAEGFHQGEPGWGDEHLARKLRIPLRIVRETVNLLEAGGFIVRSGSTQPAIYPARELEGISLDQVLLFLRECGTATVIPGEEEVGEIVEASNAALCRALKGMTLRELATGEKIPPAVDKGGADDI